MPTFTFSANEKLILRNQYEILKRLDPDRESHYDKNVEIIERGYISHYDNLFVGMVDQDELDSEACKFVNDVLDMYYAIQISYDLLADKSGIGESDLLFPGFDGNNETGYMAYVRFLREKDDRWTDVKVASYNSHMSSLSRYRRMLELWKASADTRALTNKELKQILSPYVE